MSQYTLVKVKEESSTSNSYNLENDDLSTASLLDPNSFNLENDDLSTALLIEPNSIKLEVEVYQENELDELVSIAKIEGADGECIIISSFK